MAIAYKSQGAGFGTETDAAALAPLCPATVDANDILIAHVVYLDNATAPVEPSGWKLLFPDPADISVGSGLGTGTPTGRAWAFGKIAVGTEDGAAISFGTQGGTVGRLARIYSFSGYVSGLITDVIPAASFAQNSSENDPVIQAVTTTIAGAKAVALVSQDDDNSHAGLGDVTGGNWAEAVADYVNTTVGAQGAKLQIQVGTPSTDPGTISGGTVAGTNDECNTLNFEIRESALSVTHDLLADDISAGAATLDTPALTHIHVLLAEDISAGAATLDTPTIGEPSSGHDLLADDISAGAATLTVAALSQTHILLADDLTSTAATLTEAPIGQTHTLSAQGISAGSVLLGEPTLSVEGDGDEVVVEVSAPLAQALAGKRRFGKRPPYTWELARATKDLETLTLPTNPEARDATVEVAERLETLWRELDRRDIAFTRAAREVDDLIKIVSLQLESMHLARLLEETKSRIWADHEARKAADEEAEMNDLLRHL